MLNAKIFVVQFYNQEKYKRLYRKMLKRLIAQLNSKKRDVLLFSCGNNNVVIISWSLQVKATNRSNV